ncbi:MAG: hypothetical protein E7603_07835 [Ruminococcaceae bacterium]|nr:hypothetical protein [Oscillospiraceae bacterium]
MKKIFAIFFTVLFVFAAITMAVSAAKIDVDDKNIYYSNLLDFNSDTNKLWANQKEDGTWEAIEIDPYSQPTDENGKICSPILSSAYSSYSARKWWLSKDGEYLTIQSTDASIYPGMIFILDAAHNGVFPVGRESNTPAKAEYVKIRVRNYSTCDQFTLGNAQNHTNGGKFMPVTISDLGGTNLDHNGKKYISSGEWQTYVFSMYELNKNTNYGDLLYDPETEEFTDKKNRWGGNLYELAIFPFGYDVDDGTGNYPGAKVDIDYIVMGSLDYVTNYESALEAKENTVQSIELLSPPTKTNYVVGEEIQTAGIQLKVTFNDGKEPEIITDPSTDVSTFERADITEVTVKYGTQTVKFPVTVADVTGIEMTGFPENQVFEVAALADGFLTDGYQVQINYAGGVESRTLDNSNFLFSGDFSQPGKTTVTVYYYGKSTSFEVDIIQVKDINITAGKTYRYGKAPAIGDFNIEYVYTDDSKKSMDDASIEFTFNEDDIKKNVFKAPGKFNVTVTATQADYGLEFTKEVEVEVETPIGVEVTKAPTKTEYDPNEQFSAKGMTISLIYDNGDGKTAKVKMNEADYTTRVSTATPGNKNVSIRCDIEGLKEIFDDAKLKTPITVKGEVASSSSTSSSNTTTNNNGGGNGGDFNIVPIIIIVAAIVVLGVVVAVVLVVVKKKKNN